MILVVGFGVSTVGLDAPGLRLSRCFPKQNGKSWAEVLTRRSPSSCLHLKGQ
jgi:hypothetical protein